MRIKEKPKATKKQKAYLAWMGLTPPKRSGRLSQLNKSNQRDKKRFKSELAAITASEEASLEGLKW